MWLVQAKFSIALQKPIHRIIVSIRNFYFRIRKFDRYEIQERTKKFTKRIKDLNTHNYDFPDEITHWYAFTFTLAIVIIMFFFIPLFTIDFFGDHIINSILKYFIYNIVLAAILWYTIYIKKNNKDWLKRKINKKNKKFYLYT